MKKDRNQPITWNQQTYDKFVEALSMTVPGQTTVTVELKLGTSVSPQTFEISKVRTWMEEIGKELNAPQPVYPENREGEEP